MPPIRLLAKAVAPLAAIALVLAACSQSADDPEPSTPPDLNAYYQQKVEWSQCANDVSEFCGKVKVPLDYENASQGDIEISVMRTTNDRVKKQDDRAHLGTIFTNPGGPGASGIEFHPYMVAMLGSDVLKNYAVVSFDPRGVGESAPVKCLDTRQMDSFMADLGTPNKRTTVDAVRLAAASLGDGCQRDSARLVPHLSTSNTARDMDVIRGVLDEPELDYYGASYGSNLGQVYASLFSSRVGRFVFDGIVPMWFDLEQTGLGQAKGFEASFQRFVANCPKHRGCPLPDNQRAATAKVQDLLTKLGSENLPAPGDDSGREVTQAIAYNGILAAMYDDTYGWADLRTALRQAFAGNGVGLLALSDEYAEREDGEYGGILKSYYAISCLDQPGRATAAQTAQLGKEWTKDAPLFGDYMAWTGLPCATWPAPVDPAPSRDAWASLPDMLLINYSEDPATPYEWAEEVAKALPNSALVKVPGPNHVAAFNDIECVDNHIQRFYVDGKLPASRATCPLK